MEMKEPIPVYRKEKISIEEYLEMENAADVKHEYYNGEIISMSGS